MSVANKKKKIFDGRYEVLSIVGRGACSVVYHAKNVTSPSSEVALKVLINQPGGTSSTDRLRKEALAMVSSRHKYVIRLDDFHSVQDLCYLSMEYAKEGDLRKYTSKLGGKLTVQQAHAFFRQTAEALNFVHRVGITHRDIKPDNILVLNDREIRLTDFGVAVLPGEQASLDDLQQGVGTMSYMAPEVLEGKSCDKLSDIYALGVCFYEMITGNHPFENAPLVKQLEVRADNNFPHVSKLAPAIPKQFADVIMRCMKFQPDKRFASMNDLLKALNEFSDGEKSAPTQKALPDQNQGKKGFPVKNRDSERSPERRQNERQAHQSETEQRQERKQPEQRTQENRRPEQKQPQRFGDQRQNENTQGEQRRSPKIATKVAGKQIKKDRPPVIDTKPKAPPITQVAPKSDVDLDKQLEDEIDDILSELEESESKAKTEQKPLIQEPVKDDIEVEDDDLDLELDAVDQIEEEAHELLEDDSKYLDDPRESKRASQDRPRHDRPSTRTGEPPKSSFINTVVVAGLILWISNYALYKVTGYRIFGGETEETAVEETGADSMVTKVSGDLENFPNLPAGMYEGNIYDVIPGEESKLVVISVPEQNSLIFIVAVEGWTPSLTAIPQAKDGSLVNSMRVTSNGIVLDMQGEVVNGAVEGVYLNALTGNKAKWQIKPLKN